MAMIKWIRKATSTTSEQQNGEVAFHNSVLKEVIDDADHQMSHLEWDLSGASSAAQPSNRKEPVITRRPRPQPANHNKQPQRASTTQSTLIFESSLMQHRQKPDHQINGRDPLNVASFERPQSEIKAANTIQSSTPRPPIADINTATTNLNLSRDIPSLRPAEFSSPSRNTDSQHYEDEDEQDYSVIQSTGSPAQPKKSLSSSSFSPASPHNNNSLSQSRQNPQLTAITTDDSSQTSYRTANCQLNGNLNASTPPTHSLATAARPAHTPTYTHTPTHSRTHAHTHTTSSKVAALATAAKQDLNIVLVGDGAVGKTSLITSYGQNRFPRDYQPTCLDTFCVSVLWDGQPHNLILFDTAGQESFQNTLPLAFARAHVILLCFAVDNRDSFDNLVSFWKPYLTRYCPHVPMLLVATKSDLLTDQTEYCQLQRSPTTSEMIRMAKQLGTVAAPHPPGGGSSAQSNSVVLQCSALTQYNLTAVFNAAIQLAVQFKYAGGAGGAATGSASTQAARRWGGAGKNEPGGHTFLLFHVAAQSNRQHCRRSFLEFLRRLCRTCCKCADGDHEL